ncbi:MAG: type II toxin-antitoxin system VapB family antitoxin [Pseudolabrys sp.]|nr:type II toxin-antitoxin system VapB family antitoxin [Pseudolabrys sp.]
MGEPQLNIKDADVTAMVRELTALTGESQTEAVRKALQERLDRTRTEQTPNAERDRGSTLADIRNI